MSAMAGRGLKAWATSPGSSFAGSTVTGVEVGGAKVATGREIGVGLGGGVAVQP